MTPDWPTLIMGLAGGLTLFLIGMGQVTDSLKALGDDRLRWALARLSSNRFLGATTGGVITAIIQSSSVTTVLTVGFVSAGLLSLVQAAPIIIGANLGTTVTAQVIALDITDYAYGLLAVGALTAAVTKRHQLKAFGLALAGLGLVFVGMEVMSDSMSPLKTYQPFLDLIADASNPAIALLIGAAFTGLVQSSSATTGIVVVMAGDGLIDLETGIAIILGANIGTCITAVLAALGKGTEAMRTAMVHVAVNTIGASSWIFFVGPLADVASKITADSATATPRQIANAHTVFNLANTVVFLAALPLLVALVRRLVPEGVGKAAPADEAAFLDESLLDTPVLALEVTHKEVMRLGLMVRGLLGDAVGAALTGTRQELTELEARDKEVDAVHEQIIAYLAEVSRGPLGEAQRADVLALLGAANSLEGLADAIETNVVRKGYRRLDQMVQISADTAARINELADASLDALDLALEALGTRSLAAIEQVSATKEDFQALQHATTEHLAARLAADEPGRVQAYSFEIELVEALRLVHRHCRRIARALGPTTSDNDTTTTESVL